MHVVFGHILGSYMPPLSIPYTYYRVTYQAGEPHIIAMQCGDLQGAAMRPLSDALDRWHSGGFFLYLGLGLNFWVV